MTARRAQALAPALMLLAALVALVALVAPSATADTAGDCALLRKAVGEYSTLAGRLSSLHKTADGQEDDTAALTATQRKVVDLARSIGGKLHMVQTQLSNPVLSYAFGEDAKAFGEYAETLEGAINNGDVAGANIHVTTSYTRYVEATEAANDAYHAQCK